MERLNPEIAAAVETLAALIKADPRFAAVQAAEAAYTADPEIARLLTEYNVQQSALAELMQDPKCDRALLESVRRRMHELYSQVSEHPVYLAYKEAGDAYNAFNDEVSAALEIALTGKRSDCTHDCSTCGGCR